MGCCKGRGYVPPPRPAEALFLLTLPDNKWCGVFLSLEWGIKLCPRDSISGPQSGLGFLDFSCLRWTTALPPARASCILLCARHHSGHTGNKDEVDFTSDPVGFSDLGRLGKNRVQLGITETLLEGGANHRKADPGWLNGRVGMFSPGLEPLFWGLLALPFHSPSLLLLWDGSLVGFSPNRLAASEGQGPYPPLPLIDFHGSPNTVL